jgi:hypothetical protein
VMVWEPGLDLDGMAAPAGADAFPDQPAGLFFDPAADRQGGEHDREVDIDGVPLAVVGGPCLRSLSGMREAFSHSRI